MMQPIPIRAERIRQKSPGFSLMELMAALAILGILAAVIVPGLSAHQDKAKKSTCYANKGDIELQVKLWKRNKSSYPAANLSDIGVDTTYFPGSLPVCPVDGTSYTINTTTGRVIGHTH
jgi:prepilin-type N-terminal cleavage/methylation domain-containing protein